jgi:hypothetical protein
MGFLSGKALFSFDPTLFTDDADAVDDELYNDMEMEEIKEEETQEQADKHEKEADDKDEEDTEMPVKVEIAVDNELFAQENGTAVDEDVDFD